jgi:hypothetical protein
MYVDWKTGRCTSYVLHCTVVYYSYTVLYCTLLCYTILYSTILYSTEVCRECATPCKRGWMDGWMCTVRYGTETRDTRRTKSTARSKLRGLLLSPPVSACRLVGDEFFRQVEQGNSNGATLTGQLKHHRTVQRSAKPPVPSLSDLGVCAMMQEREGSR